MSTTATEFAVDVNSLENALAAPVKTKKTTRKTRCRRKSAGWVVLGLLGVVFSHVLNIPGVS